MLESTRPDICYATVSIIRPRHCAPLWNVIAASETSARAPCRSAEPLRGQHVHCIPLPRGLRVNTDQRTSIVSFRPE